MGFYVPIIVNALKECIKKGDGMMDDAEIIKTKKRFKLKMPGAFVILFILTVVAVMATWVVPSGSYAKLSYDQKSTQLVVTKPSGQVEKVPATQASLDRLGVKIKISQFTSGSINAAVSIPNTYQRLKQRPASLAAVPNSMFRGTVEAVDIMVFIIA